MSQSDFVSRGQALVAAGQYQEAVKVCRLGLLGRPTTVEGRIVLGQALLALKRYDEVLAEMRVALELDQGSFAAQVLKGEALLKKGDSQAALEALQRARQLAPTDVRVAELLQQAERAAGKPSLSTSHPAVQFVGGSGGDNHTVLYPNQAAEPDAEDTGDSFTRPTSIAPPKNPSKNRPPSARPGEADGTPPPAVLEVGDRSGTVEVDPDLDGVEVGDDDDVAPPPLAARPGKIGGPRGSVKSSRRDEDRAEPTVHGKKLSKKTPTAELNDGDFIEDFLEEKPTIGRKGASAVRKAIGMASGPLDEEPTSAAPPRGTLPRPSSERPGLPPPGPRGNRPSAAPSAAPGAPTAIANAQLPPLPAPSPASLAQTMLPHQPSPASLAQTMLPPPAPLPPAPTGFPPPSVSAAGVPRGPIAAALPTMAAVPPGMSPAQVANAARPTIAIGAQPPPPGLSPAQQQTAAAVDALFGAGDPQQGWALAAANEPTARPAGLDPHIQALFAGAPPNESGAVVAVGSPAPTPPMPNEMRTGMRTTRSPLRLVLWIVTGVVLIGGGVFAGLQIRKMRLEKKIVAEREHAMDLAAQDTWSGWTAARASLASIADASSTAQNRAALARARALVAYEFGDGLAQAKTAVDQLGGQGGLDASLAAAYLALAQNDLKAAKSAAEAARGTAPDDPAALYVAGQVALLAGDPKPAIEKLQKAVEKEPRPLYLIGLARALGAATQWDEAVAAVDKVVAKQADHPAALIARGELLAASGRIVPGSALGNEMRSQLEKLVIEGHKEGSRVSPAQVAFADLALADVDLARGDLNQAREDVRAAADVRLEDQRFAETAVEVLLDQGDLEHARSYASRALSAWPGSLRARIALAEIALAQGKPADAIEMIEKQGDVMKLPRAQAVRGEAHLAAGDLEDARSDFDGVLAKLPTFEPALVGRAWLALAERDLDGARKLVEPRFKAATPSPAIMTVYAAILRISGDRAEAKKLLDRVVQGAPGPATARAQLELARLQRDLGDYRSARVAFAEASRTGNPDARLESGLLLIEDRDPAGGRDTLDALLKEAGDKPSTSLLLEVARARMLAGDHVGAEQALTAAAANPGPLGWKLERERGRLALRKGDYVGAIAAFSRALDTCGDDAETFLLAADAAPADASGAALADKLRKLVPERLKTSPEASIVRGKLLLASEKYDEALSSYQAAKQGLEAEHASPRRQAQAHIGLAVAAYTRGDDPTAKSELELVVEMDPALYTAHLFAAEIVKEKDPRRALDHLRKAVELDPDSVDGWASLGRVAAKLGDKKTLADAIGKISSLAPTNPAIAELQALRR